MDGGSGREQNKMVGILKDQFETSNEDTNLRTIQSHQNVDSLLNKFKDYCPQSEFVNVKEMRQSGNLKLKKSKGFSYYGEIVNGKRHGMGVMLFDDGRVFEGQWKFDQKHGKGYEQFSSGNRYEGDYIHGKPQGTGAFYWSNGQMYEGEWFNGLRHGSGTWRGVKGDSYVGEWCNGKPEGFGVHEYPNGDRYEGYFKACLKHGQGFEKYSEGDLFRGNFEQGKKNGYGEYYWKDGGYYKGDFVKGVREGKGLWLNSVGDTYEGEYKNDRKQGYGIYMWPNGNVYKGEFRSDLREGNGQMLWIDGSYYKGEWKGGNQHGKGDIYTPVSGLKRCFMVNNVIVSVVKQEKENGNYLNGSINGLAKKEGVLYRQRKLNVNSRKGVVSRGVESSQQKTRSKRKFHQKAVSQNSERQRYKTGVLVGLKRCKTRESDHDNQNFKLTASRLKRNTVDFTFQGESRVSQYKPEYRKQHIPHSSIYVHQLHRRINTVPHVPAANVQQDYDQRLRQKGILEKPYNLTRLMHKFKLLRPGAKKF